MQISTHVLRLLTASYSLAGSRRQLLEIAKQQHVHCTECIGMLHGRAPDVINHCQQTLNRGPTVLIQHGYLKFYTHNLVATYVVYSKSVCLIKQEHAQCHEARDLAICQFRKVKLTLELSIKVKHCMDGACSDISTFYLDVRRSNSCWRCSFAILTVHDAP